MANVAIIDYGMGNLRSVAKALEHVAPKQRIIVTQSPTQLAQADRVVFPGQGAIRDCMAHLANYDLLDAVRTAAATKPFLGLCLGPQALLNFSEENGGIECLGVLPGQVRRLRQPEPSTATTQRIKIPHMGWNTVQQASAHALWDNIPQDSRFYFVHSYYLEPAQAHLVAGRTKYGIEFASAIAHENIFAVQFHPEKSASAGLQLLANFSVWMGD